jgi:hypothetical protein
MKNKSTGIDLLDQKVSTLFSEFQKHLAGQHDQSRHGHRGGNAFTTADWLDKNDKWNDMDDVIPATAKFYNMTSQQYQDTATTHIKKLCDEAEVCVRVPDSVMGKILEDGRFKTQFETKKSKGKMDNGIREEFEGNVFGIAGAVDSSDRPIYGYLAKDVARTGIVAQYGEVVVQLKSSVKERSSLTWGDSLDFTVRGNRASLSPVPLNNPDYRAANHYFRPESGMSRPVSPLNDLSIDKVYPYAEIQVHKGVSISDISKITFTKKAPSGKVLKLMEKNGISWEFTGAQEVSK